MEMIYHITKRGSWQIAEFAGEYIAPSLNTEGFIHCSTADQILRIANALYSDLDDAVVLCIDSDKLRSELRWEAPAHPQDSALLGTGSHERFPHVYGPIHKSAVVKVLPLPRDAGGAYRLPEGITV